MRYVRPFKDVIISSSKTLEMRYDHSNYKTTEYKTTIKRIRGKNSGK